MNGYELTKRSKQKIDKLVADIFIGNIDLAIDLCLLDKVDKTLNPLTEEHIEIIKQRSIDSVSINFPKECIVDVKIEFDNLIAKIYIVIDYTVIEKYLVLMTHSEYGTANDINHDNILYSNQKIRSIN